MELRAVPQIQMQLGVVLNTRAEEGKLLLHCPRANPALPQSSKLQSLSAPRYPRVPLPSHTAPGTCAAPLGVSMALHSSTSSSGTPRAGLWGGHQLRAHSRVPSSAPALHGAAAAPLLKGTFEESFTPCQPKAAAGDCSRSSRKVLEQPLVTPIQGRLLPCRGAPAAAPQLLPWGQSSPGLQEPLQPTVGTFTL